MRKVSLIGIILVFGLIGTGKVFGATSSPSGIHDLSTSTYSSSDYVTVSGKNYEVYYGYSSFDLTKLSKKTYGNTSTEIAGATSWVKWGTSVGNGNATSTVHTNGEFTLTSSTRYYRIRQTNASEYQLVMVIKGYAGMSAFCKTTGILLSIEKWNGSAYVSDSPTQSTGTVSNNHYKQTVVLNSTDQYRITVLGPGTSGTANYEIVGFSLEVPSGSTPPSLTAAGSATVDNDFNITYTDPGTYYSSITSVKYGSNTLPAGAWSSASGVLTLKPTQSAYLQTAGTQTVTVVATGYTDATVTQAIGVGAATKLVMKTQPAAPGTNGAALTTQPAVYIQDQYGNATASSANVTATAITTAGTWTLGGTTTVAASSGTATFSGLTATSASSINGVSIDFTSSGLTHVVSNTFNIPAPAGITPPNLTAATGNTVDNNFNITFTNANNWQNNITSVKYGANTLVLNTDFTISDGVITLIPSGSSGSGLRTANGGTTLTVSATGFDDATVSQTIGVGAANKLAITTQPTAPASNGVNLATQPVVVIQDQYGNTTSSTATITVAINGTNAINAGTTSMAAVSGTASFSGVKAGTSDGSSVSSTLSFSSDGLTGATSNSFSIPTYASSATDYFRSTGSGGSWASYSTWQSSPDNTNWYSATTIPDATSKGLTIRTGTTVTITNATTIGTASTNLVTATIENGGELAINTGGSLTIASGSSLTVSGTIVNNLTTAIITTGILNLV